MHIFFLLLLPACEDFLPQSGAGDGVCAKMQQYMAGIVLLSDSEAFSETEKAWRYRRMVQILDVSQKDVQGFFSRLRGNPQRMSVLLQTRIDAVRAYEEQRVNPDGAGTESVRE